MLDKLPLFVWKIILPYIYADHRAQIWYEPNQVAPIGISDKNNIYDYEYLVGDDREWATTTSFAIALRRTCKYLKNQVLTPMMCEYVLSSYKLGINSKFIVLVPKPLGYIKTSWNLDIGKRYVNQEEVIKQLTPLQWIRALTLDVKLRELVDAVCEIDKYKEFCWSIHLSNMTHDFDGLTLDQDLELIGLPNTQLELTQDFSTHRIGRASMCLRNLHVIGIPWHQSPSQYMHGDYDYLIIDNCKFDGSLQIDMLNVNCNKISVTNCTFTNCNTGIKFKMDASDDDQGKHVNICDNRFDKCKTSMQLTIDYCLIGHDDLGETACVSGNVVTNVAT